MKNYSLCKDLKSLNYTFVSNDHFAATALMICELPARALELLGARAQHVNVSDFVKQSRLDYFNHRSVIVFLKIGNNLEKETITEIEKLKDTVLCMFCDVNDNYSYLIEELKEDLEYSPEVALKFLRLMDGILYESSDLKNVILEYDKDFNPLKTRHPHTNCSRELNHFSMIDGSKNPAEQVFKLTEHFCSNGIFNFGYLGRPKQCTDFLRLNRAIYNLHSSTRFLHSNPRAHVFVVNQ